MGDQGFDEPETEAVAAVLREDEDVGEVGSGGEVRDDAGAADLDIARVETDDDHGVVPGAADGWFGTAFRPVTVLDPLDHERHIEPGAVVVEDVTVVVPLHS